MRSLYISLDEAGPKPIMITDIGPYFVDMVVRNPHEIDFFVRVGLIGFHIRIACQIDRIAEAALDRYVEHIEKNLFVPLPFNRWQFLYAQSVAIQNNIS